MTIKQQQHFSFTSNDDFEKNACNYIITAANESIQRKDTFSLVLCGGRTPKNIFTKLKTENTDWSKWNIFFGDERCLPENDDDRNSSMVKKNFLNSVPIPKNQIFFIKAELGNIIAANQYNSLLENKDDFDLVLLGFGEDGHTASLFPGHYWDNSKHAVAIYDAPKQPKERVSMTASRLSRADKILFLISGSNKQDAFERWNDKNDLPVSQITAKNELLIYSFGIS